MNRSYLFLLFALIVLTGCGGTQKKLTEYVNPFLGTATLWEPEDLGYTRKIKSRTWGAETYPGATFAQRNGAAQPRYTVS